MLVVKWVSEMGVIKLGMERLSTLEKRFVCWSLGKGAYSGKILLVPLFWRILLLLSLSSLSSSRASHQLVP